MNYRLDYRWAKEWHDARRRRFTLKIFWTHPFWVRYGIIKFDCGNKARIANKN